RNDDQKLNETEFAFLPCHKCIRRWWQ
ncbi:unnamed protein product, partial [Rotaria magnacalcarata]